MLANVREYRVGICRRDANVNVVSCTHHISTINAIEKEYQRKWVEYQCHFLAMTLSESFRPS